MRSAADATIVLDTHAWLWWLDSPERLSDRVRTLIERAETIGVSAISCWEVGMLEQKGRIALSLPLATWVRRALSQPGVAPLALTPRQAVAAAALGPGFPGDPADRFIFATARDSGAVLVTRDRRLREYDARGTVW